MTGDAVDHGVGGRETRRAWSWPGWPNTTPVIVVRLPSIQRMARKAKQPPAAAVEPVLTPTNPLCPSNVLVLHGAGDRQRRARCGDDAREHRQAHGPIDDAHLVGGSRHGCVVVAARVGVAGVGHAQRPCGGIHPGNETGPSSRRPIAPEPRRCCSPTAAAAPAAPAVRSTSPAAMDTTDSPVGAGGRCRRHRRR